MKITGDLLEDMERLAAGNPVLEAELLAQTKKVMTTTFAPTFQPRTLVFRIRHPQLELDAFLGSQITYIDLKAAPTALPPTKQLVAHDVQVLELARKMTVGPHDILVIECTGDMDLLDGFVGEIRRILGARADQAMLVHSGELDVDVMSDESAAYLEQALKRRKEKR